MEKAKKRVWKDKDINRNDIDLRMSRNALFISKWMDSQNVYFISNKHDPSLLEKTLRKQKNETTLGIGGTKVNKNCNKLMAYVAN